MLSSELLEPGPPEAGPPEAGPTEAGPPEAGPPEAGPPEAGLPEAGLPERDRAAGLASRDGFVWGSGLFSIGPSCSGFSAGGLASSSEGPEDREGESSVIR